MKYMGSKNKFAKHLLPLMLPHRTEGQTWVEPFVGGANMIDKVDNPRIGCDVNEYQIALLKALQAGWEPPTVITKEEYYYMRDHVDEFPKELAGFASIGTSFGGMIWSTYAETDGFNYAAQASRVMMKQAPNLVGIQFHNADYRQLRFHEPCLIYCDPPYRGTVQYGEHQFDNTSFWKWCWRRAQEGHTIFVSEYSAPIWMSEPIHEIVTVTTMNQGNASERIEYLYRVHA